MYHPVDHTGNPASFFLFTWTLLCLDFCGIPRFSLCLAFWFLAALAWCSQVWFSLYLFCLWLLLESVAEFHEFCVLLSLFIRKILGHLIFKYSFCFIFSCPSNVYMYYIFSSVLNIFCFSIFFIPTFLVLQFGHFLFLFFSFFFFAWWCGLQILNSWPGIEPCAPCSGTMES